MMVFFGSLWPVVLLVILLLLLGFSWLANRMLDF